MHSTSKKTYSTIAEREQKKMWRNRIYRGKMKEERIFLPRWMENMGSYANYDDNGITTALVVFSNIFAFVVCVSCSFLCWCCVYFFVHKIFSFSDLIFISDSSAFLRKFISFHRPLMRALFILLIVVLYVAYFIWNLCWLFAESLRCSNMKNAPRNICQTIYLWT